MEKNVNGEHKHSHEKASKLVLVLSHFTGTYENKPYLGNLHKLRPSIIGSFSINRDRIYQSDKSQLRFVSMPPPNAFPLYLAIEKNAVNNKINYDIISEDFLDYLLHFICKNKAQMTFSKPDCGLYVNANVVCHGEVLEKLLCAPYKVLDSWKILASSYRNTIYLTLANTPKSNKEKDVHTQRIESWTDELRLQMYSKSRQNISDTTLHPNELGEFNCVFHCKINDISIVYSSAICGMFDTNDEDSIDAFHEMDLLETKLNVPRSPNTQTIDPKDALKWWCHGSLLGISELCVAHASDKGFVNSLRMERLDSLCAENESMWSPNLCVNFLVHILRIINRIMINVDNPSTVFEFNYSGSRGNISYVERKCRNEFTFISDWYREFMEG